MLQSGQKEEYTSIKRKLLEIFDYTVKDEGLKDYVGGFVTTELLNKGISTVLTLKEKKPSGVLEFYGDAERAAESLNPYTLRLAVNYLVKRKSPALTASKHVIASLLYTLALMALYF